VSAVVTTSQPFDFSWSNTQREETRFRQALLIGMLLLLLIGILVPLKQIPELERKKQEQLPPQLARVILEKKPPPAKPEPKKEQPKPPETKAEEKPTPKPVPKPATVQEARKQAEQAGLLAMADELVSMREALDLSALNNQTLNQGTGDEVKNSRKILAGRANTGSGGISTSNLSRDVGGPQLQVRKQVMVDAPAELIAEAQKGATEKTGGRKSTRSEEQLRFVLEQAKGSLYTLYNRALRKQPTLQGKVVFELDIAPSGKVKTCRIISSELDDDKLERKLMMRLRTLDFGKQSVASTKTQWAIAFLPA
jgi:type IV secretory pathway VirB10-like protein